MSNKPKGREKPIENINLDDVKAFRSLIGKTIKRGAKRAVVVSALAGGIGHGAGNYVQKEIYRAELDYNPNQTTQVAEDEDQEKPEKAEKKEIPENETWMEKAKRKYEEAKKLVSNKTEKEIEKLPVIKEVKELRKTVNKWHKIALETGDKIAYWLPFIIMFLSTVKVTSVVIERKDKMRNAIEREKRKLETEALGAKQNEVIDRHNVSQEVIAKQGQEIKELTEKNKALETELEGIKETVTALEANGRAGMPPKTMARIEAMLTEFNETSRIIDTDLVANADESGAHEKATA